MLNFVSKPLVETTLEATAFVFGILSVWYARKEDIKVYPTGIIATALTTYLLYKAAYYGDMLVNAYFTIMSVYGWLVWNRKQNQQINNIGKANQRDKLIALLLFVVTLLFVRLAYYLFNTPLATENYFDILASAIFFSAMYFMAHKRIENWQLWIVGNFIVIPLYFYRELYFLGVQYVIFNYLAIRAYYEWKQKLKQITGSVA